MKKAKTVLLASLLLTAVTSVFSQSAEEWKKMGNAALDSADYSSAVVYYLNAIEADSMYFDAYYNLGTLYFNISDFDGAIEYFSKAIAIDDTDADTWIVLGQAYVMKHDYESAVKLFKKRIAAKPDSPQELYFLGWIYQQNGDTSSSMRYVKRAAQLGDSLAQQFFTDNGIFWAETFAKPDYERINLNIESKESDFYYPALFARYQHGDSTMTVEESRHLYYGYTFNENYSPYTQVSNVEQINAIRGIENPTEEELEKLVSLLDISIVAAPFNLIYIYYQIIAYDALGRYDDVAKNMWKIRCISEAMNSTGDGLSKETAIHVIAVSNEYDYLFLNNLSGKSQVLVDGGYDVLYLEENEDGIKEMWFDISQPFGSLSKFSKEQPEKRRKERRRR